jgi:hypothetical protein
MNDWTAANRPTMLVITIEEPFNIKRLQHIIVEVEDLTNFFNGHWLQVISTIINSYLLLM